MNKSNKTISIIIPIYNEANNIRPLFDALQGVLASLEYNHQVIFVNDGSKDESATVLKELCSNNEEVKCLSLARNFGKEIALTAGLNHAQGDAAIMMDSDMQHPPKYIPKFIAAWQNGADVVVGVREVEGQTGIIKNGGSKLFYWLINLTAATKLVPRSTDFRLVDKVVIDEFRRFTERNRITRGLIDWLGFERTYIGFKTAERASGEATYSLSKLIKLATDSFVSLSLLPLRISGYLGILIVTITLPIGSYMLLDKYLLGDNHNFTGSTSVGVLVTFLIGLVLINLGLVALYIANIHAEVTNRPLYVLKRPKETDSAK